MGALQIYIDDDDDDDDFFSNHMSHCKYHTCDPLVRHLRHHRKC